MALTSGSKIGPYEVLAPLGAGGMGEVYRAKDTRLDRTVAIKVLPGHLSDNPELKARFEREARAISQLTHPHICTLYDIGHQDGVDYLVMELLEGETLAVRLAKNALPLEQVLKIGIEIASALDKAHRSGVIHRDLKPGNIMLTKTGAKLLDFGLAKSSGVMVSDPSAVTVSQPLTSRGTILGTFQYMAPEQLEGAEADARTDIFAFGAVLYETATGKRAFEGQSRASLIASIMSSHPRPISELQPMAPPALDRLIRKCLAKDTDSRWQSAADLADELRWISDGGSAVGGPGALGSRRGRGVWAAWSAAAVFAVVSVFLAVGYFCTASPPTRVIRAFIPAPENAPFLTMGRGPTGAGPVSISPDGTKLVFAGKPKGELERLYLRAIDSLTARALAGTEGGHYPFWSPDGKAIGFFADGKLKRIDSGGGPPVTMCDAPMGRGGAWNQDGVIVFAPQRTGPLHHVSAAGGESSPLTRTKDTEQTHCWPVFLPDGRHFLYFSRARGGILSNEDAVMLGALDGSANKPLTQVSSNAAFASEHLLFVRDGTLMAQPFDPARCKTSGAAFPIAEGVHVDLAFGHATFSVSRNGVLVYQQGTASVASRLVWFDRGGKELGVLGDAAQYSRIRLSPDGKLVAASIQDPKSGHFSIWLIDVEGALRTRFTFASLNADFAIWSPDGSRIVFASEKGGTYHLYENSLSGTGNERHILSLESMILPSDWSPDGRWIVFTQGSQQGKSDVWALEIGHDGKPNPILQAPNNEFDARFSPDGKWIVYTSDESGQPEIYVTPFPDAGRKRLVSTKGGFGPRWSRNGKEIYYLAPDLMLMAAELTAEEASLKVGQVEALFQLEPVGGRAAYDVTSDGRFLIKRALEMTVVSELTLVVNWPAELPKK